MLIFFDLYQRPPQDLDDDGILIKGRLEEFVQYSLPKNELSGCSTGTETVSSF